MLFHNIVKNFSGVNVGILLLLESQYPATLYILIGFDMGRRSQKSLSIRSLRDEQRLRKDYAELHGATSAWLDGGSPVDVEIALDNIAGSQVVTDPYPTIEPDMTREARMIVLGQQLTAAGQLVTRLERELTAARSMRDQIKDNLIAAVAEPAAIPDYMVRLCRQIQALGGTQMDLQPQSKALAKAMLDAARAHNAQRSKHAVEDDSQDEYFDEPVSAWRDLPERFAGFQLIEIDEEDLKGIEPCPLPPSTDIAFFTLDKIRPEPLTNRRETYQAWSMIIGDWCTRS